MVPVSAHMIAPLLKQWPVRVGDARPGGKASDLGYILSL